MSRTELTKGGMVQCFTKWLPPCLTDMMTGLFLSRLVVSVQYYKVLPWCKYKEREKDRNTHTHTHSHIDTHTIFHFTVCWSLAISPICEGSYPDSQWPPNNFGVISLNALHSTQTLRDRSRERIRIFIQALPWCCLLWPTWDPLQKYSSNSVL